MAQDDFPRVEMGFGYANLGLPASSTTDIQHNSGFAMHTNFSFTRAFGIDNYTGYYSMGQGANLFTNIFAGKLTYRSEKLSPYLVAGIGGAQVSIQQNGYYYSGGSSLAHRLGGGVDYRFSDVMALRVDVSKLQVHQGCATVSSTGACSSGWIGKMNIATSIVFTIMQ
jgi:opacity protein-like surface antigen